MQRDERRRCVASIGKVCPDSTGHAMRILCCKGRLMRVGPPKEGTGTLRWWSYINGGGVVEVSAEVGFPYRWTKAG